MSQDNLIASLQNTFQANKESFFKRWEDFVRFKSVSANSDFNQDCRDCASWCVTWLEEIGFEAKLLETATKPVVFAEYKGASSNNNNNKKILFYGHYDVQPPEPYELWDSGPFEPEIRSGRLYGRGAQDNKGQVSFFLAAVESLIKNGELTHSLSVILEGEEETGSFGLHEKLEEWKELLKADILMVCDTGALSAGVPCITMGLRGIFHLEFKVKGPKSDLHSGVFGGVVRNPAIELARILAKLHSEDGAIAIPNFYEGIPLPTAEESELLSHISLKPEHLAFKLGCELEGGERIYNIHERRGLRPTIEVNGIWSGYTGPGSKTIIPSFAQVKITGRTVRGQDPEKAMRLLKDFIKSKVPAGLDLEIISTFVGGPSVYLEAKGDLINKLSDVLSRVCANRVEFSWEGGSVPIVASLATVTGAKPVLVGFALDDDNLHAPNESFSLDQFELGFRYVYQFLKEI
jgi:acetylornithine deacetylase/succinyl-diaminopimelate desuccinylase-like protein